MENKNLDVPKIGKDQDPLPPRAEAAATSHGRDDEIPSTSSAKADAQCHSTEHVKSKSQKISIKRAQKSKLKASEEKRKLANMPFTTRSGKERLRPWPMFMASGSASHEDGSTQPLARKIKKIKLAKAQQRTVRSSISQIHKESPNVSVAMPDLPNTGREEHAPSTICTPPASAGRSTRSPVPDSQIDDVSVEVHQDEEDMGVAGAGEEIDKEDSDGEVVCLSQALGETPVVCGRNMAFDMPGQNTKKISSSVWNYFITNADNRCQAVCCLCQAVISRGKDVNHLGTSSLIRHLQRIHHKSVTSSKTLGDSGRSPLTSKSLPLVTKLTQATPPTPSVSISSFPRNANSPAGHVTGNSDESSPAWDSSDASLSVTPTAAGAAVVAAGSRWSSQRGSRKTTFTTSTKQLTVQQSFARKMKYHSSHPAAKRITEALASWVVRNVVPVSLVTAEPTRDLMEILCPRYQIPSRFHFSRQAIPRIYTDLRKKVLSVLKNAVVPNVHLTTDMWTSGAGQTQDYMTVTAHWVDVLTPAARTAAAAPVAASRKRQLVHRQATLCITAFLNTHTAENLLRQLRKIIAEWLTPIGLSCGFVASDNASNIVRALHLGKFQHVPCFAHTLNLVVQNYLKNDRGVQEMLSVARRISGHFRRTGTAYRRLEQHQKRLNLPCHHLKQEVVTRWNSTLYMLQRMEEQQKAIQAYTSDHDIGKGGGMYLSQAQWRMISTLCKVLQPFELATREVSSDTASLSQVIPLIRLLQKKLETLKEELRQSDSARHVGLVDGALHSLNQDSRVVNLLKSEHYILATVLDPRFKTYVVSLFPPDTSLQGFKDLLVRKLSSQVELDRSTAPPSHSPAIGGARKRLRIPSPPAGGDAGQSGASADIWSGLRDLPTITDMSSTVTAYDSVTIERMVEDYMSDRIQVGTSDSPYVYWQEKEAIWRPLHKLALFYLSCPPTSVYSERVFSAAAHLVSNRRTRLLAENVEKMMFIKMNYNQFLHGDIHQQQLPPESTQGAEMVDSSGDELIICEEGDVHGDESEDDDEVDILPL